MTSADFSVTQGSNQATIGALSQSPVAAFKEWAIVCDSMLRGETSLIFRKGGIAEGRDGFRFKHGRFFLFPTYFHEQIARTRLPLDRDLEPGSDDVIISAYAEVEFTRWVDNLSPLPALDSLHVLNPDVIAERFRYDETPGLHLAFLRVYRLTRPWILPFDRSFGGCRSWVNLPATPPALRLEPVLQEAEQARRRSLVQAVFGEAA
jgi:hypothetical protein